MPSNDDYYRLKEENQNLRLALSESVTRDDYLKARKLLNEAREALAKQDATLQQLTAPPLIFATAVTVDKKTASQSVELKANTQVHTIKGPYKDQIGTIKEVHEEAELVTIAYPNTNIVYTTNPTKYPCSLALQKPASNSTIFDFVADARVVFISGKEKGEMGQVISGHAYKDSGRNGQIGVRLDRNRGGGSYYPIGYPAVSEFLIGIPKETATVHVIYDGKLYELASPPDFTVVPGDMVAISPTTMQIVHVVQPEPAGDIAIVRQVFDGVTEVDYAGNNRIVYTGKAGNKIAVGDRTVLDPSGMVILQNLGRDQNRFRFEETPDITWDNIGGLESIKLRIREIVEDPYLNPEIYKAMKVKPAKGILLSGPPGCGKTMLGKAVANSIAKIHYNGQNAGGFLYVKGPEILDKYIGVAEATIRSIFAYARKFQKDHGYPAVIFIDEAESLMRKRGSGISSDIEGTIVPMFLAEMDGIENSDALLILSTNRPDILDEAIVRNKRINHHINVPRPDMIAAQQIFRIYLGQTPIDNNLSLDEMTRLGVAELFSDKRLIRQFTLTTGEHRCFCFKHVINGAMIDDTVERAKTMVIRRVKQTKGSPIAITSTDLLGAIEEVWQETKLKNFHGDMIDFLGDDLAKLVGTSTNQPITNSANSKIPPGIFIPKEGHD